MGNTLIGPHLEVVLVDSTASLHILRTWTLEVLVPIRTINMKELLCKIEHSYTLLPKGVQWKTNNGLQISSLLCKCVSSTPPHLFVVHKEFSKDVMRLWCLLQVNHLYPAVHFCVLQIWPVVCTHVLYMNKESTQSSFHQHASYHAVLHYILST